MRTGGKTGGRKAGTPNKRNANAKETAQKLGIDPFIYLLYYASGNAEALGIDEVDKYQRLKAIIEACRYIHPTLRQTEDTVTVSTHDKPKKEITDEDLLALHAIYKKYD